VTVTIVESRPSGVDATTTVVVRNIEDMPPAPPRRRVRATTGAREAVGGTVAGTSVALLLFGRIAPFSGLIGFIVVAYLASLAIYATLVSLTDDALAVRDRVVTVLLSTAAVLMGLALVCVIVFTMWSGRKALTHLNFYAQDLRKAGPRSGLNVGGIEHALVGTLWMISISMAITVPLGIACAVFLNEVGGRFARFVRTIVEAMVGLPSIIAGLFIFATYVLILHEHTGLAAALALSVDMLPIIIRSADVVLRLVPGTLREASAALGAPQWRTVRTVVLPTARSGLATAVILGMARGLGETAPVLLTAGYTTFMNKSPLHGPMVSLPLVAYELVKSGEPNLQARGYAAASVLLVLVLTLFVVARIIGGRGPGKLSKAQARRMQRRSTRDANRIISRYDAPAQAQGRSV